MHAVAGPARWPWVLSGLVVAAVLAIPLGRLITTAGMPSLQEVVTAHPQPAVTRSMTISAPVTQLSVQSYGAPIEVTGGSGRDVQVTEGLSGTPSGQLPAVQQSLSGGHLSLADPACANTRCSVLYTITVPSGVTVSAASDGAPLRVFGVAGAVLDSGGGPVQAGQIGGPLTVTSEGGAVLLGGAASTIPAPLKPGVSGKISVPAQPGVPVKPSAPGQVAVSPIQISKAVGAAGSSSPGAGGPGAGVTGTLNVDTGGGPLEAEGVTSADAIVTTGGGQARIVFSAAPDKVTVSTGGGPALLTVPGGPYALTASSGSGPEQVAIGTDLGASRSLTVTTDGGPLIIEP
jgi:hypothetical protein